MKIIYSNLKKPGRKIARYEHLIEMIRNGEPELHILTSEFPMSDKAIEQCMARIPE